MTGPRLTQEEFFTRVLNLDAPEMAEVKKAAAARDWEACTHAFAEAARKTLRPELWRDQISEPDFGGHHSLEGEDLMAAADRVMNNTLISCGIAHSYPDGFDWETNQTPDQYNEWIWQLNRSAEYTWLTGAYLRTGKLTYAEKLAEMFTSWVHQAIVPQHAEPGATHTWRTIESGIRMTPWGIALNLLGNTPAFTDEVVTLWFMSLWEHGYRLRFENTHNGNWYLMELKGLLFVCLQAPFFCDTPAWLEYAVTELTAETEIQIYPDGFQFELSPGYHHVVMVNYEAAMRMMHRYGVPFPEKLLKNLERGYELYQRIMRPDSFLPELNDSAYYTAAEFIEAGCELFPEREDFVFTKTFGKEGKAPDYTSTLLEYPGIAVMRTGWDENAVWALLDAGHFGRGHQHEDKLNLLVHAYGELLLTEAGKYAYDRSPFFTYTLTTPGHNTVMVDGMGQNRRRIFTWEAGKDGDIRKKAENVIWKTDDKEDVAGGVYNDGYGPENDTTVTHRRTVRFIKDGGELGHPYFVVEDVMTPSDDREHTYDVLWHPQFKDIAANGTCTWIKGNKASVAISDTTNADHIEQIMIVGQQEPYVQGYLMHGEVQGTQEEFPVLIHRVKGRGEITVTTIIEPVPAGETPVIWNR